MAAPALDDIADIWTWTVKQFGDSAALRYETLIEQAIGDLANDPQRAGTKSRPDLLPGVWFYHLAFSRNSVSYDKAVHSPRHFVMFRHPEPGVIEILRVLHDSRDLPRHLAEND